MHMQLFLHVFFSKQEPTNISNRKWQVSNNVTEAPDTWQQTKGRGMMGLKRQIWAMGVSCNGGTPKSSIEKLIFH